MKHGGALSNIVKHLPEQLSASAFIDAMFDEVVLLDRDGIIVAANAAWDQFCKENNGDVSLCYRGANYLDICREAVGASSAEASLIPKGFEETLQTGEPFKCEPFHLRPRHSEASLGLGKTHRSMLD